MYGVIYSIHKNDLKRLDSFEDLNGGYKKEDVDIAIANGEKVKAFTYIATNIEKSLLPFSWYKYHVLHGAVENNLPPDYISFIDSFNSVTDPDKENAADELSIYLKKTLSCAPLLISKASLINLLKHLALITDLRRPH